MFNIFKLAEQLVAYRNELTHRLQQCFDEQHPYNVAELNARLKYVDALIEIVKQDIYQLL